MGDISPPTFDKGVAYVIIPSNVVKRWGHTAPIIYLLAVSRQQTYHSMDLHQIHLQQLL